MTKDLIEWRTKVEPGTIVYLNPAWKGVDSDPKQSVKKAFVILQHPLFEVRIAIPFDQESPNSVASVDISQCYPTEQEAWEAALEIAVLASERCLFQSKAADLAAIHYRNRWQQSVAELLNRKRDS